MRTHLSLTVLLIGLSAHLLHAAAPSPPQNLSATVTGDTVTLTWEPSTLTSGAVLFGYIVEVALSPGAPPATAFPSIETTAVVDDVPAGVYYVRVRASSSEGNSAPSNEVMVVVHAPPPCTSPPHAPTDLTSHVVNDLVTLNWSAPATGCPVEGHAVLAGSAPGLVDLAIINVGAATSLLVTAPAGTYAVRVVAFNAYGISAPSNEVTVVSTGPCSTPPDAPTDLTAATLGNVVTLTWIAPAGGCPATSYVVQAGSASGVSDLAEIEVGATTSYTVAAPLGTYFVRVIARNAFGDSVASNEVVISVTAFVADLTGVWSGTSTYFNAPFTFSLTQNGSQVLGTYNDQHDTGPVTGHVEGANVVLMPFFGDTGLIFQGTIEAPNRVRGIMGRGVPVYPFEMTRQP